MRHKAIQYNLFFFFFLFPTPHAWAVLSTQEQKIVTSVTKHHNQNVELLKKLVNINSGKYNFKGVKKVADVLKPQFQRLGFTVRWIPMTNIGRAGHLVASHVSSQKNAPRILMIAHLDTVFEARSPFQHFSRDGHYAMGPGTNDIKGGIVVILSGLQALKDAGVLDQATITVFLSGDEEKHGIPISISRRDLIAAAHSSDVALDFECMLREDNQDTIHTGRRGVSGWQVNVTGAAGHSSTVGSWGGFGANYELARIIDSFRRELGEQNLSYNVGLMAGGGEVQADATQTHLSAYGKDNIIASQAMASGDLRTLSDAQTLRIQKQMKQIVTHSLDKTHSTIAFEEDYPPMAPTSRNHELFEQLNAINQNLNLPSLKEGDAGKRGAGDIGFIAEILPGLVGMGLAGTGAHSEKETADLDSLDPQAERTAALINTLVKAAQNP